MVKLSICIPTYNFGKFIGQTLDSILPQISAEVEVIVLDGGSTDDTSDVVAARQCNYPQLAYHHQSFRGGIDRDIEKVVGLAQGQYCWLFSADDIMLPGAVDKVLEAIKSNYDVYICEHILCSLEMIPIGEHPPFNNINQPKLFNLGDVSQKLEYFRSARTSEAFFSFLSGPIFKKSIWDSANVPESFRSSHWIVAGHLLSTIQEGIKVSYLCEKLLHKRGENDSFSDRGVVNRLRIAIEGFHHVANSIFGKHSEEAFHIRRVLRTELPLQALLATKLFAAKNPEKENVHVLNRIVKMLYSEPCLDNWAKYAQYKMGVDLLHTLNVINVLRPLWSYRGFIFDNVKREFQFKYRNSPLRVAWTVINPLAMIIVYTVIFSQIMRAKLPGVDSTFAYSIYLCAGVLTWGLFAEIVSRAQNIFLEHANLLKKPSFPRICLPAIVVTTALLNFSIVFSLFSAFLLVTGSFPGLVYLALIPVLAILIAFAIGLGISLGVLNMFFRNNGQIVGFIIQFWFWATPIVYPISILPASVRSLMSFNPMASLMAACQDILVVGLWPAWQSLLPVTIFAIVMCTFGMYLFRKWLPATQLATIN